MTIIIFSFRKPSLMYCLVYDDCVCVVTKMMSFIVNGDEDGDNYDEHEMAMIIVAIRLVKMMLVVPMTSQI